MIQSTVVDGAKSIEHYRRCRISCVNKRCCRRAIRRSNRYVDWRKHCHNVHPGSCIVFLGRISCIRSDFLSRNANWLASYSWTIRTFLCSCRRLPLADNPLLEASMSYLYRRNQKYLDLRKTLSHHTKTFRTRPQYIMGHAIIFGLVIYLVGYGYIANPNDWVSVSLGMLILVGNLMCVNSVKEYFCEYLLMHRDAEVNKGAPESRSQIT